MITIALKVIKIILAELTKDSSVKCHIKNYNQE